MNIQNGSIARDLNNQLELLPATGSFQGKISDAAVLVYPLNKKYADFAINTTRTTSGITTLLTTPTDRDFYITHIYLAYSKDAASDLLTPSLSFIVDGLNRSIIMPHQAATATNNTSLVFTFPFPIRVDRNTAISFGGTSTAGTHRIDAMVGGFIL